MKTSNPTQPWLHADPAERASQCKQTIASVSLCRMLELDLSNAVRSVQLAKVASSAIGTCLRI